MVFFVTGHVVGMRNAPGGIDLPRVWVDKFRPCLLDRVPVFSELFPPQLARVSRWRPDLLCTPLAGANVVPDVGLGNLRVRCPRSPYRVGIDFRGASAVDRK